MVNSQLTTFGTFTIPEDLSDTILTWSYNTHTHHLTEGTYTPGDYPLQSIFASSYGHEYDWFCATICTIDAPFTSMFEVYQAQRVLLTSEAAEAVMFNEGHFQSSYEALRGTIVLEEGYSVAWVGGSYVFQRP